MRLTVPLALYVLLCGKVDRQEQRRVGEHVMARCQHKTVPRLPEAHRKELGLQPHDLQKRGWRLRARILLDLHGRLEHARLGYGRILPVQLV